MFIVNFFRELKAWHIVRKTFKKNKREFDRLKIRSDWFGKLTVVLNRDPDIKLGSEEDEAYLHKETATISALLIKHNIMDILAYDLEPFEEVTPIDDEHEEFAQGYIITFTPAWSLDRQYVTVKSVIGLLLLLAGIITGITYLLLWII